MICDSGWRVQRPRKRPLFGEPPCPADGGLAVAVVIERHGVPMLS
jgi:hypothetical protein